MYWSRRLRLMYGVLSFALIFTAILSCKDPVSLSQTPPLSSEKPVNVYILHNISEQGSWEYSFSHAFISRAYESTRSYKVFSEYLGYEETLAIRETDSIVNYLKTKTRLAPPDVVVTLFPSASLSLKNHGSDIFGNTPVVRVVAGSIPSDGMRTIEIPSIARIVIAGTIESMRSLLPDLKRIIVISGSSETDQFSGDLCAEAVIAAGFELERWEEYSVDELAVKVSSVDSDSAILYSSNELDRYGRTYNDAAILKYICPVANAPIFSYYDVILGTGIVGGVLSSPAGYGEEAFRAVETWLSGGQASDFKSSPRLSGPKFDWRALKRWNLDSSKLPEGSDIQYIPDTFWTRYYQYVVMAFSIFAVLIAFILFLLIANRNLKLTKIKLASSLEQLRSVSDNLSNTTIYQIVQEPDGEKHFTYMSDSVQSLYGVRPEEVFKNPELVYSRVHPDDAPALKSAEESATASMKTLRITIRIANPEGGWRWSSIVSKPTALGNGCIRWNGVEFDVTELILAEQMLESSESRLRATLENTPNVAIQWYDLDGRVVYWNYASELLYGLSSTEAIGKTLDQLIYTTEEFHAFLSIIKEVHQTGRPYGPFESKVQMTNGRQGFVLATTFGIELEPGKPGFVCMDINITDNKKMEEMLKIEKNNFEIIFESSPIAILVLDESTNIIRTNAAAVDLFGGDESLVIHHRLGDAMHCAHSFEAGCGNSTDCPLCPVRSGIENLISRTGGQIDRAEMQLLVIREKIEQKAWLEISAAEMHLENQRAFIVSLQDITVRKQIENIIRIKNEELAAQNEELAAQNEEYEALNEELIKTNEDLFESESRLSKSLSEKEILIREIYHRTKNTMQVIRGMIVLQADEYPKNIEIQQLVKNTEDRIQSISLVHQMLYQSQDLSQISIKEYVYKLSDGIMQSFGVNTDRITLNFEIEELQFLLDTAIPFGLILNELLTNSLKYAFPEDRFGEIKIVLSSGESNNLVLKYSDNGIGVPDGFDFRKQNTMGLQLIYGLGEQQMMGKVSMENKNGLLCVFEFHNNLYKARV